MKLTMHCFTIGLLAFILSCGSEGSTTNTGKENTTVAPEAPISKQAADLNAQSQAALNRSKLEMVEDIEKSGSVSANKINAKLATDTPVAAATTPILKEGIAAKEGSAVKVKEVTVDVARKPMPAPVAVPDKEVATSVKETAPAIKNNNTNTTPVEVKKEAPRDESLNVADTRVDHSPFDALLKKHVSATGKVNYKGIKSDQSKLDAYLETLASTPVQNDWTKSEKMAYWINVYNAFTIKLIVDNYPVKSITDLEGGKPWAKNWIKIGAETYSLDHIENKILRPQFKEAAIHFAVNCAAKSCPPLLNAAWTADNLKSNFKKQATAFVNNPKYNKISADKIEVSKIFDWYKEDFGNLVEYLNKYSTTKIDSGAKVVFMEYDWSLNE